MRYTEYHPKGILKDFIQCYFVCETDIPVMTDDKVFATGAIEILFNLGADGPQQIKKRRPGNLSRYTIMGANYTAIYFYLLR